MGVDGARSGRVEAVVVVVVVGGDGKGARRGRLRG